MTDILKGLTAGGWAFLVGWVLPATISTALFAFFVFPSFASTDLGRHIASLTYTERVLTLAFAALFLAVVANAMQTPLYRALEGYSVLWPMWLRATRKKRMASKKVELWKAAELAGDPLYKALMLERYGRFPPDDREIAPTRLGNNLRALETYGQDRYMLDSQILWEELMAPAPESVRKAVETSRAGLDFFVSSTYFSGLLSLLSLSLLWSDRLRGLQLLMMAAVAAVITPTSYSLAVVAVDAWRASVRALVNVGRIPLAQALGFTRRHRCSAPVDDDERPAGGRRKRLGGTRCESTVVGSREPARAERPVAG